MKIVEGVNEVLQLDDSVAESGAAYLFVSDGGNWSQNAYIKASNTDSGDTFGYAVSLSRDGLTLAVSAVREDSGFIEDQNDNSTVDSGAVYIFVRDALWSQQAYIKPNNIEASGSFGLSRGGTGSFGSSLDISKDGSIVVVGDREENSDTIGLGGDTSNKDHSSGAAYQFTRNANVWIQQAHIKASNPDTGDLFGTAIGLSDNGNVLAVGASSEDSDSTGINAGQNNNLTTTINTGAVYLY